MIIEGVLSIKEWFENIRKNSTLDCFYNFRESVEKLKNSCTFDYFTNIKELFKNKRNKKFIISLKNFRKYLKKIEEILEQKKASTKYILEKYTSLVRKKVKLIIENKFYKSLYNWIKKDSENIEGKILKILFQGIENKYSPEKCLISL